MALFLFDLFFPAIASAQACDEATRRIYHIAETQARQVVDSLQVMLDLAAFVRECEDEVSLELELWLLNNEVFALDRLGRYNVASEKVDQFFATHFDDTSDLYRARFYLWRLHLKALSGKGIGMVVDYLEAQRYASALGAAHQASLHVDGAYAYMGIRDYETAQKLAEEAENEFLFRVGVGWEIDLSVRWTATPEMNLDFVDGRTTWVYGISLGARF